MVHGARWRPTRARRSEYDRRAGGEQMTTSEAALGRALIDECKRRMFDESQARLLRCLETIDEERLWWRPNESTNSIGNLVLHLCGNIRQWIVAGLGGAPDDRHRSAEFSERGPIPASALRLTLADTMAAARAAIDRVDPGTLLETRRIQGFDETGLSMLVHVVEHVSYHTGQVTWIVKSLTGTDLGYYAGLDLEQAGDP